jgi:UDP-3-O-acyl-N-acetylglucosamine deacetylase
MASQSTIERPVEADGIGLHTAVRSRIRLNPAPPDTGIVFRRVDLDNFESTMSIAISTLSKSPFSTALRSRLLTCCRKPAFATSGGGGVT